MEALYGNPIHEWIARPIPDKLWHYTSLQGFMGIVSGNGIYATDIRFLNDRQELVHAKSVIDRVVASLPIVDGNGWTVQRAVRTTTDAMFERGVLSPNNLQIFVSSFSTAEDQLSQWRAYSRGSTGVSLGFDLRHIRPDPNHGGMIVFAQCIYDDKKKEELISGAIQRFVQLGTQMWKHTLDAEALEREIKARIAQSPGMSYADAAESVKESEQATLDKGVRAMAANLASDMLLLSALLKHSSFSEEQEWRLVLPRRVGEATKKQKRQFRINPTSLVPYIEFDLRCNGYGAGASLLTDLILGPGTEPVIGIDATKHFLQSKRIDLTPRESKAPFRPW